MCLKGVKIKKLIGMHLIWLTFDIKEDGQLMFYTLLYRLLQGRNLLCTELVSEDKKKNPCLVFVNSLSEN